jgi:hypothetical protein
MDFLPVREEGVREFLKQAKKGLRYGEDLFFCIYSYQEDSLASDLPKYFLSSMVADQKKNYAKFLLGKILAESTQTALNLPVPEISKEQMYKSLAVHIPASDFFDVLGADYLTKFYVVKLMSNEGQYTPSEEGGNSVWFVVNTLKKEVGVLHTTFL